MRSPPYEIFKIGDLVWIPAETTLYTWFIENGQVMHISLMYYLKEVGKIGIYMGPATSLTDTNTTQQQWFQVEYYSVVRPFDTRDIHGTVLIKTRDIWHLAENKKHDYKNSRIV